MAARPGTAATRIATARAFARAVRAATRPGSPGLGTRLTALPRLARSVRRGEYGAASAGQLLTLLASAVYVASPVDILPEGILGVLGLGDDALVLAYAASAFVNLTEDFLAWERAGGASTVPGPPRTHRTRPASGATVEGSVVR